RSGDARFVMLYLFDIDGTLIGGDGSGRRALERACHDHLGILGALEHLRLDGMTDPLILESVFRHHHGRAPTVEETGAIFDVYVRHLEAEVAAGLYHVKPAVHDTLDHLEKRGATIGLATGNLEAGARIKLQRGDLWHRFAFGGFGSDAAERAELVRVAIERGCARAEGGWRWPTSRSAASGAPSASSGSNRASTRRRSATRRG